MSWRRSLPGGSAILFAVLFIVAWKMILLRIAIVRCFPLCAGAGLGLISYLQVQPVAPPLAWFELCSTPLWSGCGYLFYVHPSGGKQVLHGSKEHGGVYSLAKLSQIRSVDHSGRDFANHSAWRMA